MLLVLASPLLLLRAVADDPVVNTMFIDAPVAQFMHPAGVDGAIAVRTENNTLYTSVTGGRSFTSNRLYLDAVLPPDIYVYPAPYTDALEVAPVGKYGGILVAGNYGVWFGIPDITNGGDRYRFDFEPYVQVKSIPLPVVPLRDTDEPGLFAALLAGSDGCANASLGVDCHTNVMRVTWIFKHRPTLVPAREYAEAFQWYGIESGVFLWTRIESGKRVLRKGDIMTVGDSQDVVAHPNVLSWRVVNSEIWATQLADDGTTVELVKSVDGGASWSKISVPVTLATRLLDPSTPIDIFATGNEAVFVQLRAASTPTGDLFTISGHNPLQLVHNSRRVDIHNATTSPLQFLRDQEVSNSAHLAPVAGFDGAWILNRFTVDGTLETVVTHTQGKSWARPVDADCPAHCSECDILVNGWIGAVPYGDADPSSHDLNPGIVTAVGRVGSEGSDSWWISTDGAATFSRVLDVPVQAKLVNGGALLVGAVAAQPVADVRYSWDSGVTLSSVNLTFGSTGAAMMLVQSITTTDPTVTDSTVMLMGVPYDADGNATAGYLLVHVDFAPSAPAVCADSDLELWSFPLAECVLGLTSDFMRRRTGSACMLDAATIATLAASDNQTACPCTADDYACDYCYELSQNNECLPSLLCLPEVMAALSYNPQPGDCTGTYGFSQGYSKVFHSVCTPNPDVDAMYDYTVLPCPVITTTTGADVSSTTTATSGQTSATSTTPVEPPSSSSSLLLIILIVVVLVVLLVIAGGVAAFIVYKRNAAAAEGGATA